MLWGCFAAGGAGDLEINSIINSTMYQDIFAEKGLPLPGDFFNGNHNIEIIQLLCAYI